MKLSIITICYNQPDIEETCESVVNQSFQDFEWIVIDGGSTDGTVEKLDKYKDRINIFISEKDFGRYNAMNKGIRFAGGEWLNFMNGGDKFADESVLEKAFDQLNDADIVYGEALLEDKKKLIYLDFPPVVDKEFFLNSCLSHQASFIKKELFEKYGLYEENYLMSSDWEKWLCFLTKGARFKLFKGVVSCYKADGITFDKSNDVVDKMVKEKQEIYKKYYKEEEMLKIRPYKTIRFDLFGVLPIFKFSKYINKIKVWLFGLRIIQIKRGKNA